MSKNHNRTHASNAALTDLAPYDEVGTPDNQLVECECGTIYRVGDEYHQTVCEVAE